MPSRRRPDAEDPQVTQPPRTGLRALGFCLLACLLVAACMPWPVASPRLAALVADELARSYGLALTVEGRSEVALLPLPHLKVHGVRLAAGTADGPVLADGGSLSLHFGLLALVTGRLSVKALSLDGAVVTLSTSQRDARWETALRRVAERVSAGDDAHPTRLALTKARVTGWDPRDGSIQTLRDVDVALSWPLWSSTADIAGAATWKERTARFSVSGFDPGALLAGGSSRFAATAGLPETTLSLEGTARFGDGYAITGFGRLATQSLPEVLTLTGGAVALAPLLDAIVVEADFEAEGGKTKVGRAGGGTVLLPRLRVAVGGNRLDGAGSVAFAEARPAIQATLAADTLSIAPVVADLLRVFGFDEGAPEAAQWRTRPLSLAAFTAGDLDLRLSAASARIGPILVEDIASSLLVRDGRIEASLGRATVQDGTLKGRIVLGPGSAAGSTEIRAQGACERLDFGALLIDLGEYRWVLGDADGTFAVESQGATLGDIVGRLGGRASLAINGGTITGLDLAALMLRDRAALVAAPVQRTGRTDFARAGLSLQFRGGVGTITDAALVSPSLTASLDGTLSLTDRTVAAMAALSPRGAHDPMRYFAISGPLGAVVTRAVAGPAPDAAEGGVAIGGPAALRSSISRSIPAAARAYAP